MSKRGFIFQKVAWNTEGEGKGGSVRKGQGERTERERENREDVSGMRLEIKGEPGRSWGRGGWGQGKVKKSGRRGQKEMRGGGGNRLGTRG